MICTIAHLLARSGHDYDLTLGSVIFTFWTNVVLLYMIQFQFREELNEAFTEGLTWAGPKTKKHVTLFDLSVSQYWPQ